MRGRPLLVVLLIASLGVALAPAASTQDTSRVTIALNGFENNITPFTHSFGAFPNTHDLVHLVYDSLFWSQSLAEPEPWLAESAEPSDDFSSWTVTLRDDVTWHDGEPFTADDVQFTMEYYVEHAGDSGRYAHHVADMPLYESSEIVDDHTIVLHFAHPAGQFKIMPGADLPILPRHQWEDITEPGTATQDLPIGTGPYQLVQIDPDQQYRFEANEDYFHGKPLVDELVMPIIREPSAAFAALLTGDVDYVANKVPPELIEAFEQSEDIEVARGTIFESVQLYFNTPREPLDDPQLRKAMAMAVDREAIVDIVLLGNGTPGRDSFMHPESPWAIDEEVRTFDPEAAAGMLDDAGYTMGDDGTRVSPAGDPLSFVVLVSSFEPQSIRTAQLLAEQMSEIGIDLDVQALDPATIGQRRRPPPGGVADFDMRVGGLESHAHVDPDALMYFFHTPGERGFGETQTSYANPDFDDLALQAGESGDLDQRRELLDQMQQILAEDVPMLVATYPDGVWAYRPAAYDGWFADFGHSPLTKRSFLAAYAETGTQDAGDESAAPDAADDEEPVAGEEPVSDDTAGGQAVWALVAVLAVALLVVVVLLVRQRGPREEYE